MFVPLSHPRGHAQVDFGEAMAVIGGEARKIHFFAMDLPHSDGCFVKAYPAETSEGFCDGHIAAFAFFGGVLRSILYDNTTLAVARILGDGTHTAPFWVRAPISAFVQVSRTPGTRQEVGHGVAGVGEAPRHEIAGVFQVYGDLTGAAMMAALA